MTSHQHPYLLHTNYRSTCSGRVRIALNLKRIPYDAVYIDTSKGEQHSTSYSLVNPGNTVPCLQNHDRSVLIAQSLAAIEYLDEQEPDRLPRLLPPPSDPAARAVVRGLAYTIAVDVQPLTSSRIRSRINTLGGSADDWSTDTFLKGLGIYEKLVASTAGTCSCGDSITLADVCLVPAVWKAIRSGIDVEALFPTIWRVYTRLNEEDAIVRAHPRNQPDCPPGEDT